MRVIGFIGMRKHSVRECSLNRAAEDIGRDDSRCLLTLVPACKLNRKPARWEFGTGNHSGERIEDDVFRLLDNLVRQSPGACLAHVRRKRRSNIRSGLKEGAACAQNADAAHELEEVASREITWHCRYPLSDRFAPAFRPSLQTLRVPFR